MTKTPFLLIDACLEKLAKNPYGMTAAGLAHELGSPKANVTAALTEAVAAKILVDYKVAKNHRMYSLPNTCGWSTYAAKLAGIEAK